MKIKFYENKDIRLDLEGNILTVSKQAVDSEGIDGYAQLAIIKIENKNQGFDDMPELYFEEVSEDD